MHHAYLYISGKNYGKVQGGATHADGDNGAIEVISYSFHGSREIDVSGQASSGKPALLIEVETYAFESKDALFAMFLNLYEIVSGHIDFLMTSISGSAPKYWTLTFDKGAIIDYHERFDESHKSMTVKVVISAGSAEEAGNKLALDWAGGK